MLQRKRIVLERKKKAKEKGWPKLKLDTTKNLLGRNIQNEPPKNQRFC